MLTFITLTLLVLGVLALILRIIDSMGGGGPDEEEGGGNDPNLDDDGPDDPPIPTEGPGGRDALQNYIKPTEAISDDLQVLPSREEEQEEEQEEDEDDDPLIIPNQPA